MALDTSEQATQSFLDAIRLDGTEGYRALWRMKDRVTEFFSVTDTEAMTVRAFNLKSTTDLYYSIGTLAAKPDHGRGTKRDVAAIPGLWLDLDANNNPAHPKGGFPATIEDVRNILRRFDPQPSIVVYSGGGLQAIWLLDKLWPFSSDEDRTQAEDLLKKWRVAFNLHAKPYTFDSVPDVSRVLRLPGSRNLKFTATVNAGILKLGDKRYTLGELQARVSGIAIPSKKAYADTKVRREGEGRDNRLWSFAGLIRDAVDSEAEMYALLSTFNEVCFDEQLSDDIVRSKAERVMRYEVAEEPKLVERFRRAATV